MLSGFVCLCVIACVCVSFEAETVPGKNYVEKKRKKLSLTED